VARADLTGRIRALSGANDLLTAENWSAASVPQIVDGVVGALSIPRDRLELDGGPVRLGPKPALQLALALHELATNAVKYGALSNDTGRLTLRWGLEEQDGAQMFTFS
jgi:two-component sensor histidine kinase